MNAANLNTTNIYQDKTYPAQNRFMQYKGIQEQFKGLNISMDCAVFSVFFQDKNKRDYINTVAIPLNDLQRIEQVY